MTIIITHDIVEMLGAGGIFLCFLLFVVMLAGDDWSSDRPVPPMYAKNEPHATKPAPTKAPPPPKRTRVETQAPPAWQQGLSPEQLKEIAAMGYPVGPTPEMPLRAPETRFYAPASLTLPDWVCGPVTAKLYRVQLDRAAQLRELVSGIPPYREPTVDDLSVIHKTGLPPSHMLKLETFRK